MRTPFRRALHATRLKQGIIDYYRLIPFDGDDSALGDVEIALAKIAQIVLSASQTVVTY
jgi:hypothetical protein